MRIIFLIVAALACGCQPAPQTAKEARAAAISSQFDQWDGSHIQLTRHIKSQMSDPNSYEHVQTRYIDREDHLIVTTVYRGRNAFGGMARASIAAKIDDTTIEIIDRD